MSETLEVKPKKVKFWAVILGFVFLIGEHGIYTLGHIIADAVNIAPVCPKIDCIDNLFPIVSIFIIPYIWSYVFWVMGPIKASKCETEHFKDFMASIVISLFIGMIMLIFLPTYMDRQAEGLFSVGGTGIFDKIREFWYSLDGGQYAFNLLPSFHCINSTICLLGVLGRKEISKAYQIYSVITAILIYLSTMYVKQHYFLDVVSGIALAIIVYFICKKCHLGRMFNPIERLF